jgi:probable HAF family extracellular repeat protein
MSIHERLGPLAAVALVAVGCTLAVVVLAAPAGAASLLRFRVASGHAEPATAPRLASSSRASAQFRTADVPGATGTLANVVNNRGTLLGTWFDSQGAEFGFIEPPGGQPSTFNYPGTTGVTVSSGLNDIGTAVGAFVDSNGAFHGWVRSADGNFTELDDPSGGAPGTGLEGINDRGVIVGFFHDASGAAHGFVYDRGTFTTLDFPGGSKTVPTAVNDSGAIVGSYTDASGVIHGFLYQRGTFTTIDAPGAGTAPGQGTMPTGISSNGVIVGFLANDSGPMFGWLLSEGRFSSLNDPNAPPGETLPAGVSSNGRYVAGGYIDASGALHGFVATLTP